MSYFSVGYAFPTFVIGFPFLCMRKRSSARNSEHGLSVTSGRLWIHWWGWFSKFCNPFVTRNNGELGARAWEELQSPLGRVVNGGVVHLEQENEPPLTTDRVTVGGFAKLIPRTKFLTENKFKTIFIFSRWRFYIQRSYQCTRWWLYVASIVNCLFGSN
jgi:hypothetical protein